MYEVFAILCMEFSLIVFLPCAGGDMDPVEPTSETMHSDTTGSNQVVSDATTVDQHNLVSGEELVIKDRVEGGVEEDRNLKRSCEAVETTSVEHPSSEEVETNDWKRYKKKFKNRAKRSSHWTFQTSAGDEVRGLHLGLNGNEMESGLSITARESSVISGKGVTTRDEVGAESSCDPLEVTAELWKKYDEHCAFVKANPDCDVLKLSLEEFVGQTDADESEFGPKDTLETIWLDIIHNQEYPFEKRITL
ncbi:hypothetical protein M758_UG011500 [Ceratodon purpureus]|nr:hypothetical protein M758_UG011500 [Ceratodon purpureus]